MGSRRPPDPFNSTHAEGRDRGLCPRRGDASLSQDRDVRWRPGADQHAAEPRHAMHQLQMGSYIGGACGSNTVLALATVLGGEDPAPPEPTPSAAFAVT